MASKVAPGERAGIAIEPLRILLLLRRGLRAIVLSTVVSAGLGVIAAKTFVKREYEARAILQWEVVAAAADASRDLQTVLDSVKLPGPAPPAGAAAPSARAAAPPARAAVPLVRQAQEMPGRGHPEHRHVEVQHFRFLRGHLVPPTRKEDRREGVPAELRGVALSPRRPAW